MLQKFCSDTLLSGVKKKIRRICCYRAGSSSLRSLFVPRVSPIVSSANFFPCTRRGSSLCSCRTVSAEPRSSAPFTNDRRLPSRPALPAHFLSDLLVYVPDAPESCVVLCRKSNKRVASYSIPRRLCSEVLQFTFN